MTFLPEFVNSVPEKMEEKVLYISIPFSTTIHLCPCGCGNEIVNKLSPVRWKFTYDGETISLYPSIGNWSLPCKSHYWIKKNEITWSDAWSDEKILRVRKKDEKENEKYQNKRKKKK